MIETQHIVIAMKPLEGNFSENASKYGVAGLNIDGTRIGTEVMVNQPAANKPGGVSLNMSVVGMPKDAPPTVSNGRWPANVVLQDKKNITESFPPSKGQIGEVLGNEPSETGQRGIYGHFSRVPSKPKRNDSGSAARFFKQIKA